MEDQGGAGTARGHWKESVYQNELMTGFLSGNSQPMSRLTVQALRDLGYVVDLSKADAFTIPSAAGRRLRDLKRKSDLEMLGEDMEKGERELQEIGAQWERGYQGEVIIDLPTKDKELTEDGKEKTDWETGFDGEVLDFDAVPKTDAGAIAGGIIGALAVVGAAAAFVVIRRRKNSMDAKGPNTQMTSQNPMFGSPNDQKYPQQHYPGQYE